MPVNRSDLADFSHFLAIARHRNFRRAGLEQRVSASALSHSLKGLEQRLGVRLFNRTNRSVTLTTAGEALYGALIGPFEAIDIAIDSLNHFREAPAGRIRLNVPEHAATLLLAPVLPQFVDRYPGIEVEVCVSNHMVDVIEDGFDAGIRYGGTVPEDMVARRLSSDIRWVVVGAASYLSRFGTPAEPVDLLNHLCLKSRLGNGRIYQWELEREGIEKIMDVPGAITLDDTQLALSLAVAGTGLVYLPEPCVRPHIDSGALEVVLPEWSPCGPGFHIYYSGRQHVPVGLKLLIDMIREIRPLGL